MVLYSCSLALDVPVHFWLSALQYFCQDTDATFGQELKTFAEFHFLHVFVADACFLLAQFTQTLVVCCCLV